MPIELPLPGEAQIKAMAVGLETANTVLPYPLCTDPMLPLAATLAIIKAVLDSNFIVPKGKEQYSKVGNYFAEWLATVAALEDKSTLAVVALYNAIHVEKEVGREGQGRPYCLILLDYNRIDLVI